MSIKTIVRALRLPFTTASALPFIFGSFFASGPLDQTVFWFGLVAVIAGHLGANLINDYADSKSGADWNDKESYNFFGGSKLIQEGTLSEKFYLTLAVLFSGISALSVIALAFVLHSMFVIYVAVCILLLSWSYSMKPLQFSYHRLGEFVIFILFGPVPVMAGYYLQTGIFPDLASFIVSLPFGLLTAAILYANEIPDYADDVRVRKHNWANALPREKAYLGYLALSLFGLLAAVLAVALEHLSSVAFLALIALPLIIKAASVLKRFSGDKMSLLTSSKLAIGIQTLVSLALIAAVW